jgi:Domain of unknown function (DUF4384)
MLTTFGLLSLLIGSVGGPGHQPVALSYRPRVEIWTDRGDDPYVSGQGVRVHFRTEQDAYVTILRIDTDGRVRVLYPREPWEDNFARGGRDYEVPGRDARDAFYVDDYPGVGYIFAVVAGDAFVYDALESRDHWNYRAIGDGRVHGDPYVAVTELAERIVPAGYGDWDYDLAPYYVQRHYDYPRFLCYDCHSFVSYSSWSPYDYTCVRFRIVVFDDPYYYPYRSYGATRVVFTRPLRPEPRFIFKDRQASDPFVTRVRARPTDDNQRREVGVRGRDLGGTGVIPPPGVQPRPRSITGGDRGDGERGQDQERARERPRAPDRPAAPEQRARPDQPDHQERPAPAERGDRSERREPPARGAEPRVTAPPRAPRPEPRAEPRREAPPPRSEPRAEPKRDVPKEKPRAEPELKRRKP